MEIKVKACPFCGSDDIELSTKHVGYYKYHIAMYCKKCHCYGPRDLVKCNQYSGPRDDMYKDSDILKIAIRNWNRRERDER